MKIILLSGGSGTRLWPLSNAARSKQFLKLLKNPSGEYESMVQRVYRQIKEAGIEADVVITTGESQVDSIRTQLGAQVDIIVEPERRDTFPAIALSAAYLYLIKHMEVGETVLVMPVDPYAELEYFSTFYMMDAVVQQQVADIVLMGVNPTYPSEKYGYIVPEKQIREINGKPVFSVKSFKEKPSLSQARELLSAGAYWNGGVFAFKLNYLLNIVKQYMLCDNYSEFLGNYKKLCKNSFDYEVIEKEKSIAMISYNGEWKDLGTWNTLVEEMDETYIGEVIVGEGITDTTVINETNLPVVVLGIKNAVVVASPDGILVADKEKSSYMKSYIEHLENRPMYEECQWGDYQIVDYVQYSDEMRSLTRHLTVKAGQNTGRHCHDKHDAIWAITDGTGYVEINNKKYFVARGDTFKIPRQHDYTIYAEEDIHLIEVQME